MRIEPRPLDKTALHCFDENRFKTMVDECAYFKAEKRGFMGGFELQDWLEAEQEIRQHCLHWFQGY